MKLGSKPLQEKALISGNAKVLLIVRFSGLSSGAKETERFEIGGNDGAPLTFRYSEIPIQQSR